MATRSLRPTAAGFLLLLLAWSTPVSADTGLRAILYEEPVDSAAPDATVTAVNAVVNWKFVNDGPNGPQVEARLAVPDRNMTITFSLHKNADDTLPASHLVEVMVDTTADSPGKSIGSIPRVVFKQTERARGQPLVGSAEKVADGVFWIALSGAEADLVSNLSLMRDRSWIDLPFFYENGQRAILAFEKGPDGEAAFEHAFAAWGLAVPTSNANFAWITIPEGLTSEQVVACLTADSLPAGQKITGLTVEQNAKCREWAGALTGPAPPVPAEGALLPSTYVVSRGDTRAKWLNIMMRERDKVLAEVWASRAPDLSLNNIKELAVLASIVEKETSIAEEQARIASVFINRLRLKMRLQSDPTFVYGIFGGKGKPDGYIATAKDRDAPTPYNTYTIDGLPPGPIANPGRAALEAVANPAHTRDLFFVADGAGGHVFAETYEEHRRNLASVYASRGNASAERGEYDRAIADFDQAIRLKSDHAEAYYGRGNAYSSMGDFDRAIADFDSAIRLKPEYGYAYYGRANAYYAKGNLKLAFRNFSAAAGLIPSTDPWQETVLDRLAEIEMKLAAKPVVTPEEPSPPKLFIGGGIKVSVSKRSIAGREVPFIEVVGEIKPGDEIYFKQALLTVSNPVVIVSLESPGGDLRAGMEIGRTIWSNQYETVVEDGICASACALAWLAGRPRFAAAGVNIGFHAPTRTDDPERQPDSVGSAFVGGYLTDLGFKLPAIAYMTEREPNDMNWLTSGEARSLGIYVEEWVE